MRIESTFYLGPNLPSDPDPMLSPSCTRQWLELHHLGFGYVAWAGRDRRIR